MSDNKNLKAIVLLLVLSLIWGTSFILIKQGLKVFGPTQVATLRVSSAFLFLLPVALTRLRGLQLADYKLVFVSGLLGIFLPAFMFSTAQTKMDSSLAGILNTLSPIATMIVGTLLFGQRFKGYAVLGTLIGLVGTVMLMLSRDGAGITGINYYTLLIVAACIMYAANLNWVKFKIQTLPPLTITSVSILTVGPLALTYLLGFTDFTTRLTTVATLLFTNLVKISTPLFASSVTYIMPVVSVGWGLLDGEKLYLGHYVGMAAILGGVYLANRK